MEFIETEIPQEVHHCPRCLCKGVLRGPSKTEYKKKFNTEEERKESIRQSQKRYYLRKKAERDASKLE